MNRGEQTPIARLAEQTSNRESNSERMRYAEFEQSLLQRMIVVNVQIVRTLPFAYPARAIVDREHLQVLIVADPLRLLQVRLASSVSHASTPARGAGASRRAHEEPFGPVAPALGALAVALTQLDPPASTRLVP